MDRPPHFAYLFERFPSFTQTFCAREVMELQRQGTRLQLYSIRSVSAEAVQHFPQELIRQVTFLPDPDPLRGYFCRQHSARRSHKGYVYLFNNNTCDTGAICKIVMLKESATPTAKPEKKWEYE